MPVASSDSWLSHLWQGLINGLRSFGNEVVAWFSPADLVSKNPFGGFKVLAAPLNSPNTDLLLQTETITTTINYSYDPLYRLTAADYDDGTFFHYTYDGVGNRLTQTTDSGTNTYTYDPANRLTSVDGVTYTWDSNGNLLFDGATTYAYNSANKLENLTQGADSYTYGYNGLGDRVRQAENSQITNYVLDLTVPLTQVLADETETYLYGLSRIGQQSGLDMQYFLTDALGSMRQLADYTGTITLARSYQPYGTPLSTTGSSTATYGYTGEWTDGTGLLHLRARYYSPQIGRFVSRDLWVGDSLSSLTLNRWIYVKGNPVRYVDPSGYVPTEDEIIRGVHVYSCNCGWIDFKHADPRNSMDIHNLLNAQPTYPNGLDVRKGVLLIVMRMYFPANTQVTLNAVINTQLSYEQKIKVALGIFMEREGYRERLQAISFWAKTSFSEEDLTSDLIGFYSNIYGFKNNPRNDVELWNWLSSVCGFPSDKNEAKMWSLEVFRNYPTFMTIKQWESPRLICNSSIDKYCSSKRKWPPEFSTINPIKSSVPGQWWWYRGIHEDGIFLATNLPDVYFLYR